MTTEVNRSDIQEYYGKVLQSKEDLKTSACCSAETHPPHIRAIMSQLHGEILDKFYGCGSPLPHAIEGCTVLDLGCGTGRDAFVLSRLVGETGEVIGVDMTDEQLEVANRHREAQARAFGYAQSNVRFLKGYIEELDALGVASNSIDVVVSNCVVNLSFDKERLLNEIYRVLKPGGELYFSDVYASRRIPDELKTDPALIGECIAGVFYKEDFRRAMLKAGFPDVRNINSREIQINDPHIKNLLGMIRLYSETVRAFKLDSLEDRCEDFGQHAIYRGTIPEEPHCFTLDDHHCLEKGRPMLVCGNTAAMLSETRFAPHFDVQGDRSVHYGLFDCAPAVDFEGDCIGGGCC